MTRLFDWMFRDRATGAVVIAQWPNLPLWLFAAFAGLAWALDAADANLPKHVGTVLHGAALVCLAWWALDEVIRGVNPWRRILGASVLVFGLWRLFGQG